MLVDVKGEQPDFEFDGWFAESDGIHLMKVGMCVVCLLAGLRVLRVLKIARYNKAMKVFKTALLSVKEELIVFASLTTIFIYLASVGIYYFEHEAQHEAFKSILHSMWWSLITLTTVGYGDIIPITLGGRIFTFFLLMIGLSIIAIPAGLFASALSKNVDCTKTDAKN